MIIHFELNNQDNQLIQNYFKENLIIPIFEAMIYLMDFNAYKIVNYMFIQEETFQIIINFSIIKKFNQNIFFLSAFENHFLFFMVIINYLIQIIMYCSIIKILEK